ncbi:neuferricin [Sphaeramia orbicularis]|uniref:Neuferricin n=1 Tax=Sphaeramia orbicularis TaxID=375764 RepID=A0A673BKL7_9TELE|nr:neuferricin [Sphaeramia orbicularis]
MFSLVLVSALSVLLTVFFIPRQWSESEWFGNESADLRLLSSSDLKQYGGEEGSRGLYLALLGQVFDVHRGHKHYGPGGAYHCMAGKDASLSFITGDFTDTGLTDDVSSLSPVQLVSLYDWLDFYHREYRHVGFVIGRFYSEAGHPTETLQQVEASAAEGRRLKVQAEAEKVQFPPCNSEWSSTSGGRVWCSTRSGGVERDWTGVPRRFFAPGSSSARCVCVKDPSENDAHLKEYDGCPSHSHSCHLEDS